MKSHIFDEQHILAELKHYLPSQSPLKDFIHHNSLHAFQNIKFYDAIFKASKIFGFQATTPLTDFRAMHANGRIKDEVLNRVIAERFGVAAQALWRQKAVEQQYDEHNQARIGQLRARWKQRYQVNLDDAVQPLLFRLLSHYLDQGIAIWAFPDTQQGLLASVRHLESASYVSLFKSSRARQLLAEARFIHHKITQYTRR
ncbi:MAG: putative inorganic carbon transporter subunit DabA [Methylotenera sp.]